MRIDGNFPEAAWAELEQTACFLHSLVPCKANPGCASPYEMLNGSPPDVSFVRVIGSTCYVHKFKPVRDSVLDTRADRGTLLGYSQITKGYRVLMSLDHLCIVDTMHVTFSENLDNNPSALLNLPDRSADHYFMDYIETRKDETRIAPDLVEVALPPVVDKHVLQPPIVEEPPIIHRRQVTPAHIVPIARNPYPLRNRLPHQVNAVRKAQAGTPHLPCRINFKLDSSTDHLKESMTTTINELYDIKAVELVPLLPTDRPIKAVWVHQDKLDSAGNYLRTKSRICPQGFRFRPH